MKTQYITIDEYGDKYYYADKAMTILHREDGPAIENSCGAKQWWVDGYLHREDGPAIENYCGGKEWWVDGKPHHEDGPAIENANGAKEWWVDGKLLTEEQFNARFATVELTMDQIATKFGVSVEQLKITK